MASLIHSVITAWLAGLGAGGLWHQARRRGLNRWLVPYFFQTRRRSLPRGPVELLLCIADHFEPKQGDLRPGVGREAVARWVDEYPKLFGQFRDSDGRPPRHTFFYPEEEYEPDHLDALAGLCRRGFGEVEVHLHHDGDTAEGLREKLLRFKEILAGRHGLLARDRTTGVIRYGFIHGNWALDNSRPDGRWCGVNNELDVLRETGCYADFTLPSAPSPTQTRKINSIYYAVDDPLRPRSHDWGQDVGSGAEPPRALLLVQGPLVLDWRRRKWRLFPHVENGCLQRGQPPDERRIDAWLRASVRVRGRPDWYFVKLHTHGVQPSNVPVVLGEPMVRLHEALARRAAADPCFRYHYVTAREVYNLVRAAEGKWRGTINEARDASLAWNGQEASKDVSECFGKAFLR